MPAAIELGLAPMVTVGAAFTVTAAAAEAFPPAPLAFAVYVVDDAGVTDWVPPAAPSVYELPSLPLIVTCVALLAATVKVDALPAAIDEGLAAMLTTGNGLTVTVAVAELIPPGPAAVTV